MSLSRYLGVLLFVSALTACPGGGDGGPSDGGPQPGDSGVPGPSAPVLPEAAIWETTVGVPFERVLGASGGAQPLTYLAQGLPSGLTLDARTGTLSGTPSIPGRFELDISVKDTAGRGDQKRYFLLVLQAPGFVTNGLPEALVGTPYSARLEASGGKPPLTYSATAALLPSGLSLDTSGTLSGTPLASGTFTFEASVTDAHGAVNRAEFTFEVRPAAPVFFTTELPPAYVSQPYRFTLAAEGGIQPYTWSRAQGAFPPGITLSAAGELTGTSSTAGTATFTLKVEDARGQSAQRAFTFEVLPHVLITSSALPDAYRGSPYPAALEASGGSPPYSWALASGTPPPGLTLSSEGRFSGTATASGAFSFTARVTDSRGSTGSRALTVTSYMPPSVAPGVLDDTYVGESYSESFSATEGKPPYSFLAGALPQGLTLSSSGVLSGTATAPGTTSIDVTVSDANGRTGSRTFPVAVYAPVVLSPHVPEGRVGQPYSESLSVSGGKPPYTFVVVSDRPPSGISLASNGVLSGTPTGIGADFGVRVNDANGRFSVRMVSMSVYSPPRITTAALPDATLSTFYSELLSSTGTKSPFVWGYSGTLPPGLTLRSDGALFGTPTATGTWSFTVTLTDSVGEMTSRVFPLTVRGLPSDGGTTPDGGSVPDGGTDGGPVPDGGTDAGSDGGFPSDAGVPFTVAHWNIEWFGSDTNGPPRSTSPGGATDDIQFANARSIVLDAGVNLWGLIEIADSPDFQTFKSQLPGYDGFLSDDPRVHLGPNYYPPNSQKLGVLYDTRLTFQSATLILTAFANDFAGRPPLRVDFLTSIHGSESPLTVIVLHMKAFADQASYDRRQRASAALKNYLDALPSSRVLVVGDWNDDVDQSITFDAGIALPSPYENFNQDFNDYTFVTRPLSLAGESSTTGFPDLIDHTLITDDVVIHYLRNSTQVLRPSWIPDYSGTTSDHYPVLSRYAFSPPTEPRSLSLTGPNGGTYPGYSQLTITWDSSTNIGPVRLSYSLDSGASWNPITTLPDGIVGRFNWTVPNEDSTNVLLRITQADTGSPQDISDVPLTFVYVPPAPPVFINEVLPNEPSGPLPGGGTGALTDYEFVEIYNGDTVPVDLSGWTIWDGVLTSGARHVFAAGTVLQPGQVWVVYGGPTAFPPGTPNTVAASSGRLGLNNTGLETVTLRDAFNRNVSELAYETTQDNVSFNRTVDGSLFSGFVLHTSLSPLQSSAGRRADGNPF